MRILLVGGGENEVRSRPMLHLFRKYQKYIFLFTTILIVVSFGFFGTYQAIAPALRGGTIDDHRPYVAQMADFLKSEAWMQGPKLFSANYLNEGILTKELFETGMATLVYEQMEKDFQEGLRAQLEKERLYTPYFHPNNPTLKAEMVWAMLAPEIPEGLTALKSANAEMVFPTKVSLLLAQKNFPPLYLAQVLRYQERENIHIPSDPRLMKDDLSLFGYQDLTDWFGSAYIETLAQVIIDMAEIARKEGYRVSKEEVRTQLAHKNQKTFEAVKEHMELPAHNGEEFFNLYTRVCGMSEATIVKVWEDITLFRRLLHGVGNAALVDMEPLTNFYAHAHENVTLEVFQMPKELRFTTPEALEGFESYLAAVAPSSSEDFLSLPTEYAPIEEIEARAPQLVGKRYRIYYGEVSKKALQANVSLRETWNWECDPENWERLTLQFPELANAARDRSKTTFEILEGVSDKTRQLIDAYARKQIVETHPEWVDEACKQVAMKEKELFLTTASESPLEGVHDLAAFGHLLDAEEELISYTQDGEHYFRILVQERSEMKEVLSYREAHKEDLLEGLSEQMDGKERVASLLNTIGAPAHRFEKWLAAHKEGEELEGALAEQWAVEQAYKTITRSAPTFITIETTSGMEPKMLSEVTVDEVEGAYYFRFLERKRDTTVPMEKVARLQKLLSDEARLNYFQTLLPILCSHA